MRPVRLSRTVTEAPVISAANRPRRPAPETVSAHVDAATIIERPRRTRTQAPPVVTKEEFPRGGCMKNPPEHCEYSGQFEPGGNFWVENVACAFFCRDEECATYIELKEGAKLRIQRLHYKTPSIQCPHCESGVAERGDDRWVYACSSIADKRAEMVIKNCGKKEEPKPIIRRRTR